jgi:hypothetical protein
MYLFDAEAGGNPPISKNSLNILNLTKLYIFACFVQIISSP